jgi:hypothetical protein
VGTRVGEGQPNYRDIRESTKRQARSREDNLKRIVDLHRERHLHSFDRRGTASANDGDSFGKLEIAA